MAIIHKIFSCLLFFSFCFISRTQTPPTTSIYADLNSISNLTIANTWSTLISWDPGMWMYNLDTQSAAFRSYIQSLPTNFPFLKYIQLFTATGGCYNGYPGCSYNRDLLNNPADKNSGVNASSLIYAINNILQAGFLPYIVTGNVPISFSNPPVIGGFGVNSAPPANMTEYSNYISDVVSAIVKQFSLDTVKKFRWGVYTEYNNLDWLNVTEEVYFQIYDYTVCGLVKSLGNDVNNVQVGAHACTQCGGGAWDPTNLIPHVTQGVNYCTGNKGTPFTFWTNSFYETAPGQPGDLSWFDTEFNKLINQVNKYNLTNIPLGIDEGRLLVDNTNVPIGSRAIGQTYQGSFDALFFKKMVSLNLNWYSRWAVNTNGLFGDPNNMGIVDTVATNVARLNYKLLNHKIVPLTITASSSLLQASANIIDGVIGVSSDGKVVRVLLLNHNIDMNSNVTQNLNVKICNFSSTVSPVSVTTWAVDDTHAQFWTVWWQDMLTQNLTSFQSGWSIYGETAPCTLSNSNEKSYWNSRVPTYQQLATLKSNPDTLSVSNGCLIFNLSLPHHGVILYEIPRS